MSNNYVDLSVNYDEAMRAIREIKEKNQLLQDSATELKSKLDQINIAWDSTGKDKMAICSSLESQITKIRGLNSSLSMLGVSVLSHLEVLKELSERRMG